MKKKQTTIRGRERRLSLIVVLSILVLIKKRVTLKEKKAFSEYELI